MAGILLCGLCPLPFENTLQSFGPGIRTWQFAASLAAAGHRVHLLAMCIPGSYDQDEVRAREEREGVLIERLDQARFFDPATLHERLASIRPRALVGATLYGSHVLAKSLVEGASAATGVPFWADQFGHVMAEAQAKARLEGQDWPLDHFWSLLRPILQTADKISVVSRRQRYAAIGELGLAGRLSAVTCGYDFTSVVPCALVPPRDTPRRPLLRGETIPEDAFVALWSGGYNVWSDVGTLFEGLERAMAVQPRIHFVSTGGAIGGHDEETYPEFEARVAGSPHRDRYHLEGWVRAELVPSYQAEADLGVLTEIPIYEGLLGSKNRVVQWMGSGLPVAYNRVGDLGELLSTRKLGLTFATGDARRLSEQILWAAEHPGELSRMAQQARAYTESELTFSATTRELIEWAARPAHAPDIERRSSISSPASFAPPLAHRDTAAPAEATVAVEDEPPGTMPGSSVPGSSAPGSPSLRRRIANWIAGAESR